jgi:hypothetical protein
LNALKGIEEESACIAHLMDAEGLDCADAHVLYLNNRGLDLIKISMETGVPYDRVFDTVAEFKSLLNPSKCSCGGLGV